MANIKYTDEELIEWIRGFETRREIREDNFNKYATCLRRGLEIHFPIKRTKTNKKVQSEEEKRNKWEESKRRRMEFEKERQERREERERRKKEKDEEKRTLPSRMYIATKLDNGKILCGRCLEEKEVGKKNKSICDNCYKEYMRWDARKMDHNKWNVRDEFCHTQIRYYEKTFDIGIKVDQRLEDFLKRVGYEFIFKEVYDR